MRIRALSLDTEGIGVYQIWMYATYWSEIQVIVDTIPIDERIVEGILLSNLIRVLRIGNHGRLLFVSFP